MLGFLLHMKWPVRCIKQDSDSFANKKKNKMASCRKTSVSMFVVLSSLGSNDFTERLCSSNIADPFNQYV